MVVKAFSTNQSQSLPLVDLTEHVNSDPTSQFTGQEIVGALERMQDANQVMLSEGVVFLI